MYKEGLASVAFLLLHDDDDDLDDVCTNNAVVVVVVAVVVVVPPRVMYRRLVLSFRVPMDGSTEKPRFAVCGRVYKIR